MIRLVISEIAVVVALGILAGLAGGFGLGRYVTSLLFEVKPGHALLSIRIRFTLWYGEVQARLPLS